MRGLSVLKQVNTKLKVEEEETSMEESCLECSVRSRVRREFKEEGEKETAIHKVLKPDSQDAAEEAITLISDIEASLLTSATPLLPNRPPPSQSAPSFAPSSPLSRTPPILLLHKP